MAIIKVPQVHRRPFDKGGSLMQALVWVLMKIVPKASSDYDACFPSVSYWLVEIDEAGYPMREIGFTTQDTSILFAPTHRNLGLWTDSDRIFSRDESETQDDFPFDTTWNHLLKLSKQVPF
jgi:hypothetical protein